MPTKPVTKAVLTPTDRRLRVIIIDDSPEDRAEVRRLLLQGSQRRYDFVNVETGAAGIRAILDAPGGVPDCVVLDYRLPDFDAPEVLAALAGPDQSGVCPVVVITGNEAPGTARAALWGGAQSYVGKGWMTPDSLTRAIENAMERWAMDRALGAREVELRLALEATKTGTWARDITTDEVIWSPECYAIYGVPEGSFDGTMAGFYQLVHPEDRAKMRATGQAAIEAGSRFRLEFRIIRPNHEVYWAESVGRTIHDARGNAVRMLGTVTDISERKAAEAALKARERELQSLADNIPDIISRFDRGLRYIFVNAAVERLIGVPPSNFTGKTFRDLGIPTDVSDPWDAALRSIFETGQPVSVACEVETLLGKRYYESQMVAEAGPEGDTESVLAITHDATDRQNADRALRVALDQAQQAVRSRDELAALVSHDLKNPLNTLSLSLSILNGKGRQEDHAILRMMSRQLQRMNRMIDDLLDATQLHAGAPLALALCDTDLVSLTRSVIEEYQQIAPEHRFELRTTAPALAGSWDPKRLDRVINNLLSNAVKYSPNGGTVHVDLASIRVGHTMWAALHFTDEGIGISAADQARIFEWYARGQNALEAAIPGTGIGLAGARDIIAQHGGSLSVESVEGEGATFTVRLPLSLPLGASGRAD